MAFENQSNQRTDSQGLYNLSVAGLVTFEKTEEVEHSDKSINKI
jgi:hypothetical protein